MAISLSICKGLTTKTASHARRQLRGHKKINGTAERSRMVVIRPARHLYVQVIDNTAGRTLVSASTMEADLCAAEGDKSVKVRKVGEIIAQRAKEAGTESIVFDRIGNKYHGRIAAFADATCEAGPGFQGR